MCFEKACDRERILRCLAHAQRQRSQSAQQQPGLERAEQRAGVVAVGPDRRPPLVDLLRHQNAREHVAVAVQVLGRRVHDQIGAERERAGQDRRRGGAVDGKEGAGAVRDLGGARDVDHVAAWGWRASRSRRSPASPRAPRARGWSDRRHRNGGARSPGARRTWPARRACRSRSGAARRSPRRAGACGTAPRSRPSPRGTPGRRRRLRARTAPLRPEGSPGCRPARRCGPD